MIYLASPFDQAWKDKDPFAEVKKIQGKTYREVATRQTLNFIFNNESFYIKMHKGTSLREAIKNFICLRMPIWGARNGYEAINRLQEVGVHTMSVAAFAERGANPLTRESFIITRDLNPTISLEDFCRDWKEKPPAYNVKKALIEEVAKMVGKMHRGGVNHRDCYLCHFLLHIPIRDGDLPKLSIIDLHRAQIREQVPVRWRDKDLVGLYFSSQNIGLREMDYLRFLKIYFEGDFLKNILKKESGFLSKLQIKADKISERTKRKGL